MKMKIEMNTTEEDREALAERLAGWFGSFWGVSDHIMISAIILIFVVRYGMIWVCMWVASFFVDMTYAQMWYGWGIITIGLSITPFIAEKLIKYNTKLLRSK